MRGKPGRTFPACEGNRITPACAGKTSTKCCTTSACKDHPRVCGENRDRWGGLHEIAGSPPRVRGKQAHADAAVAIRGITPACAGKTRSAFISPRLNRDHPRVCGENSKSCKITPFLIGSPPRVRGKHDWIYTGYKNGGITPACAGKTVVPASPNFCCKDHPRVCGENAVGNVPRDDEPGSPPRVRGKLLLKVRLLSSKRITPACAGKTVCMRS